MIYVGNHIAFKTLLDPMIYVTKPICRIDFCMFS